MFFFNKKIVVHITPLIGRGIWTAKTLYRSKRDRFRVVCTNVDLTLISDQCNFKAKYLQNDEEK